MKKLIRRACLPMVIGLIAGPAEVAAATFSFSFENDGDLTGGNFGTVMASDAEANQLAFEISANTAVLGAGG